MSVGAYMKNRLLLLLSAASLLLCGCKSDYKTNQPIRGKPAQVSSVHQLDLTPATTDNCVQTEGDYLTVHYCIDIINTGTKPGDDSILMQIDQLPPSNKVNRISAVGKWAFDETKDDSRQYGYKALAGDRYYEIDWSKEPTYFRIWNKDRTKLIEEEPVIKGPESLLKE